MDKLKTATKAQNKSGARGTLAVIDKFDLKVFLSITFALISIGLYSQSKRTFSFADKNFSPGQVHTDYFLYEIGRAQLRPESMSIIDSITNFMTEHPNIRMEIGVHLDSRAKPESSTKWSSARAEAIRDSLIRRGIPGSRLDAKGYEDTQLLIPDSEIKKRKSKQEQEELHAKNRRTVLKIISMD